LGLCFLLLFYADGAAIDTISGVGHHGARHDEIRAAIEVLDHSCILLVGQIAQVAADKL
jgi:aerobic-type carbon monoxide dehydrogenase small subunit (CoxS/CutS family)